VVTPGVDGYTTNIIPNQRKIFRKKAKRRQPTESQSKEY